MEAVIQLENVSRRFGEVQAVRDLTLEVYRGEIFGFLGHNGAGKTTTIRLVNGVLEADQGKIRVLGFDPQTQGPQLRARTGVITETASMDNRLTALDNLTIYADLYGVPRAEVKTRVSGLLAQFELAERANDRVAAFSTGMRQRLAFARALLHQPEILFLDEPTSGLDPMAARQVHSLVTRLAREEKRTVFICTHNLVEAQRLCDRVAVMEHGQLVAAGSPHELASRYVRRLMVNLETDPAQRESALEILAAAGALVDGQPELANGGLRFAAAGREAIPQTLSLLVNKGIRVYHLSAEEPDLEDVYFALHAGKEQ